MYLQFTFFSLFVRFFTFRNSKLDVCQPRVFKFQASFVKLFYIQILSGRGKRRANFSATGRNMQSRA